MQFWNIYLLAILVLIGVVVMWIGFQHHKKGDWKSTFVLSRNVFGELIPCSIAYCVLLFIMTLAIAVGIWMIALAIIYVPSEFFQNYFGTDALTKLTRDLHPYVQRSQDSPGITGIPLLDYTSLVSILVAPFIAAWTMVGKYQKKAQIPAQKSNSG